MHDFAIDPLALDFTHVVPVRLPSTPIVTGTGNDAFFNALNNATIRAITFLEATNATFDRYSAAYAAGDKESAVMQMAAYLYYLNLFNEAAHDLGLLYAELGAIMTSYGITNDQNGETFLESLKGDFVKTGFSGDFTSFLFAEGWTDEQITKLQQDMFASTSNYGQPGFIDQLRSISNELLPFDEAAPASIPEPPTITLIILFLSFVMILSNRRRGIYIN